MIEYIKDNKLFFVLVSLLVVALAVFLLGSFMAFKESHKNIVVKNAKYFINYYKDERTNLCFASHFTSQSHIILVPCENIKNVEVIK